METLKELINKVFAIPTLLMFLPIIVVILVVEHYFGGK